jgi:hypothetical protein
LEPKVGAETTRCLPASENYCELSSSKMNSKHTI